MTGKRVSSRKWFYPVVYGWLIVISMLPPLTRIPYDPRNTQDVIVEILRVSLLPYRSWGWVFHIATLAVIALSVFRPQVAGRVLAAYMGVNYLLIAALQTNAQTERYGFAVQTGALVATALLGFLWLWVAWRNRLHVSFSGIRAWRWLLFPLALLAFWSPVGQEGNRVIPDFSPLLLLTSVEYGLAYCFVTPVFLFVMVLAYPHVDLLAFRVTAFNGLLYGLFNLTHWFDPDRIWMGVLHVPLLVLSAVAWGLSAQRTR